MFLLLPPFRNDFSFAIHQIIICLFLSLLALLSSARNISTKCVQLCGERSVPYPFGFSDGCEIKLNCSNNSGTIKIGKFHVKNVTSDQIMINTAASCDRSIEEFSSLFTQNFAPTSRNGLLFERCRSPLLDCRIPDILSRYEFKGSKSKARNDDRYNLSCYAKGSGDGMEFLDYEEVKNRGNCSILYSSFMVDFNSSAVNMNSTILLEFQTMELKWWITGDFKCDVNAIRVTVRYRGRQGFRCMCEQGYAGDGFVNGKGCAKESESRSRLSILLGGAILGASTVVILALISLCIKRHSKSLKNKSGPRHLLSEAVGNSTVPFYTYAEIEKATNGFDEKQRLGTGAYGTVYLGKLHNGELVAIKRIKYQDDGSVEQVTNEIKLLSSISHPNLVRLLGYCIDNGEQVLVYEYMPNGTLSQHLHRERGSVLPWTTRLTIAAETAQSIAHLHSAINPPVYHRDIKSSNILLDYNFRSKVADFGLSRFGIMDDSHISTAPQGTPGYVDPQYHQNYHLSDKSDVYSFGVVLVEIITAMKVVDFSRHHSEINLAALATDRISKGLVEDIIDPFIEPNRDAWTLSSVHEVTELAFRCLAFHRDMRPSMMEVVDALEQIRLSSWAPLEENMCMLSPAHSSCSSPNLGSEKSMNTSISKKIGGVSTRIVSQRAGNFHTLTATEEAMDSSPVSVHDPWLSEQSSPSTNSLLGKEAR